MKVYFSTTFLERGREIMQFLVFFRGEFNREGEGHKM